MRPEQPLELALMRREHHRPRLPLGNGTRTSCTGEFGSAAVAGTRKPKLAPADGAFRIGRERRQRVGVEHDRGLGPSAIATISARRRADAAAGADQHGILPLVLENGGEPARHLERFQHDGRQMRGVDRKRRAAGSPR